MVLQRERPVPVWGIAPPGTEVTVDFAGQRKSARADYSGRWRVDLDPMPASAEPRAMTVSATSDQRPATISDILVGEVWICSGQSNMEFLLKDSEGAAQTIAEARHPGLRQIHVPRTISLEPRTDLQARWEVCTPETAGNFSAVAYHFGALLQKESNVPVGLIHSSYGGSVAESWVPREVLRSDPVLSPIVETWDRMVREYPTDPAERARIAEANRTRLLAEGHVPPPWSLEPRDPGHFHRPSVLFNGMIRPLIPVAARGVLWYQGESNFPRAWQYRRLLPASIQSWRHAWNDPDLWFLIVQLPKLGEDWLWPNGFAEVREAQMLTAQTCPKTAISCNIDQGEAHEVHPRRKIDIGQRLARLALGRVHGKQIGHLAPMYRSMAREGASIRLHFDEAQGLHSVGGDPTGFEVAGSDRKFVPVQARIEKDTVVLTPIAVTEPVAVRYAWANDPVANIYNGHDLPLFPFRTDDWPGVTDGRCEPDCY
jgi:sialate O-acetylesterase